MPVLNQKPEPAEPLETVVVMLVPKDLSAVEPSPIQPDALIRNLSVSVAVCPAVPDGALLNVRVPLNCSNLVPGLLVWYSLFPAEFINKLSLKVKFGFPDVLA